jgi:hypothetical protein
MVEAAHGVIVNRPAFAWMLPMPIYRYYCLDAGDRVIATGLVDCETDDDVQARAGRLLDASDHASIEIRYGGRHVQRVDKSRSSMRRGNGS